ncbi:hypothetical protein BTJ68_11943 [Hortaea werneckii EXF-2000]|uniref:Aminotransferase class I/classII domain-containing protein n=1 Tax=Hortaea werneckii EXF-2000 TaxID=1157616 RepID=A0A1Z5STD6_HORWE|nr:hypothetical protein BTJ68_11943 [Hortaea werneckii EXF-2000]
MGKRPHLMYTVTMGQNPTSGVLSLQRRREIYALCSQYDIIIVEDDPYWYLQFPTSTAVNTTTTSHPANQSFNPHISLLANGEPRPEGWTSSGYAFLDSLVPSFISIDTDGRVIRLDTFSKTVAPDVDWPSGFVQSLIAELVLGPDHEGLNDPPTKHLKGGKGGLPAGQGWKADGWVRWLEGLRGNYERRMKLMCSTLDEGRDLIKSGRRNSLTNAPTLAGEANEADEDDEWAVIETTPLYSFDWPVGGMFIWLRIHFASHPLYASYKRSAQLPASPAPSGSSGHGNRTSSSSPPGRSSPLRIRSGRSKAGSFLGFVLLRLMRRTWSRLDKGFIEELLEEDEQGAMMEGDGVQGENGLVQMIGPC